MERQKKDPRALGDISRYVRELERMKVSDFKLQTCVGFYVKISSHNEVIYQFVFSFLCKPFSHLSSPWICVVAIGYMSAISVLRGLLYRI